MKTKKILGFTLMLSLMLTIIPMVFACEPPPPPPEPGFSPGYWKGRCAKYLRDQPIEWDLYELIALMPAPYNTWSVEMFIEAFKGSNSDGHKTFFANLFNTAAELGPWIDD